MREVLIVSPIDDIHSFAVAKALRVRDYDVRIFDSASFPTDWMVTTKFDEGNSGCILARIDGTLSVDLRDVAGIWWRRPQSADLSKSIQHPSYRRFAAAECEQALVGSLVSQIRNFVNPIQASKAATRKIDQLALASRIGLRVPRTLITTDPKQAQLFYTSLNSRCIYKTFTGCDFGFFETRIMTDADLKELWRLKSCPTIFQEHIEGDYDLRVTIVDKSIFAARLLFKEGTHPVDSRVDRIPIEPAELPANICTKLLQMMDYFGLLYAAIDMRYGESGGYTFFEINPEGQFLWIEIETGLPISHAVAALLVKQDYCDLPSWRR
jgi:hypothetical protein